jgi:hypothetical protein
MSKGQGDAKLKCVTYSQVKIRVNFYIKINIRKQISLYQRRIKERINGW